MVKFWLIARQEYGKRVWRRSFWIGTLIIPVVFAVIMAVTILVIEMDRNREPIGFVDHSGLLSKAPTLPLEEDSVEIILYADETTARAALEAGEIQAYYVLPANYAESLEMEVYYLEDWPDGDAQQDFDNYIRAVLLPANPNPLQTRIIEGPELTLRSIDGQREFRGEAGFIAIFLPMIVAIFFVFAVMGASGYFLQAITDEKENRTMELMITSISPWQLIGGKALGLLSVGLTQIGVWMVSIAITWFTARHFIVELQSIRLPWDVLVVFALFLAPSFALIAAMMIAIGGIVTEYQEGQQIAGVLNLLFTFPLFMVALMIADPNSPLVLFLSYWPTTSFLTITMRWGLTTIPLWQVGLSWLILLGSALAVTWAATRIFRFGMLRYGQRLDLKMIMAALRRSPQENSR